MTMKMKGALPKGEHNGLTAIHGEAVKNPTKKFLVIGVIDAEEEVVAYPAPSAKFALRRIEAVPDDQAETVALLLERITEARTGKTALDLGIEWDLNLADVIRKQNAAGPKSKRTRRTRKGEGFEEQQAIEAAPAEPGEHEDVVDAEIVDGPETADQQDIGDVDPEALAQFDAALAADADPEPEEPAEQ